LAINGPRRFAEAIPELTLLKLRSHAMPKMKTNRGAAKRFSRTGSGQYKSAHAHHRHILTKKTTKRKRQLRGTTTLAAVDVPAVRRMLPYD